MGTCQSTCNAPSSEDPHLGFEPKLDTQNAYFGPLVIELQAIYNAPLVPVKKFLGLGPEGVVPCCQVSVTCHDSAGNLKANEYHWPEAAETHNPPPHGSFIAVPGPAQRLARPGSWSSLGQQVTATRSH